MKNDHLRWSVCLGLISSLLFSQNAYVTGNAKIKVEPNTLVYFGQNLELTNLVTANATVENAGNIKINGSYKNNYTTSGGANFVSTWTDADTYGQVIINDANLSTSQPLAMQKGRIDPDSFDWGQFAVPFHYSNVTDAMLNLFGINGYPNSGNRYKSPMMVWDNTSKPEFDHLKTGDQVNPTDYVILNLVNISSGILPVMQGDLSDPLLYKGVPANEKHINFPMNPSIYPASNWSVWKEQLNSHGEKYKTYIDDQVRNGDDNDYGKYYFQFGNPYTSNIDLTVAAAGISNLMGVTQLGKAQWENGEGLTLLEGAKATYDSDTGKWTGFPEALIVKPFEPFMIVLKDTTPESISFDDGIKTFAMEVDEDQLGGKNGQVLNNTDTEGDTGNSDFYQLILRLYDNDGKPTGNRVAIAVTPEVENGVPNVLEAEYYEFSGTGFYLDQERADGEHVTVPERKMDINTVNTDFIAKPIPLFFDRTEGDVSIYLVKAELFKDSIFNKLKNENENFSDGNTFFFYDNETDELTEVKNGSVFQITLPSLYGPRNRYEVYWNEGPPDKLGTGDQLTSSTIIYKDSESHFVKFDDDWTSAEVKVYDLSGRKIMAFDNVDTRNKLEIKLPARGVYVVKITANTGEVYTRKIIK